MPLSPARDAGRPRYLQIADDLSHQIQEALGDPQAKLRPGGRFRARPTSWSGTRWLREPSGRP